MTESSRDIIVLIDKMDGLKKYIGSIRPEASRIAFPDKTFSIFPLYYLADKVSGDINDMEQESISFMFNESIENGTKIKAMNSVLMSTIVWTDMFAFNVGIEASNNLEIMADTIVPYTASEILWGLVNIAAIDSALTLPVKRNVLAYIKASLDDEGWDIPPLSLMFKNITDLYDNQNEIAEAKGIFGKLSIKDVANLDSIDGLNIENRDDLKNYIIRNQEVSIDIIKNYEKLMFDWTTIVSGG